MGWERGIFFSGLPTKSFLKISLHDLEGSWRPQIGNVLLVPQSGEGQQAIAGSQEEVPIVPQERVAALINMVLNDILGASANDETATEQTGEEAGNLLEDPVEPITTGAALDKTIVGMPVVMEVDEAAVNQDAEVTEGDLQANNDPRQPLAQAMVNPIVNQVAS